MQQVNLYTDAFKPKKVILPLSQIIMLPILAAVLLGVATYFMSQHLDGLRDDVQVMESDKAKLEKRIVLMEEQAGKMRMDDSLVAANQRLTRRLSARRDMVEMLDKVVVKDDDGFSGILLSLARQNLDSLWLQRILLSASGKQLTLQGYTSSSESVPLYLQKLRQEQSFIGRTFKGFNITQTQDDNGFLRFSLSTSGEGHSSSSPLTNMKSSTDIVTFATEKAEGAR